MTSQALVARLREIAAHALPAPGRGQTAVRHRRLFEIGREDLSLARLAEAHFDALAILDEAGLSPAPQALYGVWASEKPGESLAMHPGGSGWTVTGPKMFCSGAGLIDRALVTVSLPEQRLVDIDLKANATTIELDFSAWKTAAFGETQTARITFKNATVSEENLIGTDGWYLERAGFWHGACGPAACWAGGAARLVEYALRQTRSDPHTRAHLAAMYASVWALDACLDRAGGEIDRAPNDAFAARIRARTIRHLVEQAASDILRRLLRAYGPYPLAFDEEIARHYQQLDLYLRQWHAERDLDVLGHDVMEEHAASLSRSRAVMPVAPPRDSGE